VGLFLPEQMKKRPIPNLPVAAAKRVTPASQQALLALEVIESKELWQPDL